MFRQYRAHDLQQLWGRHQPAAPQPRQPERLAEAAGAHHLAVATAPGPQRRRHLVDGTHWARERRDSVHCACTCTLIVPTRGAGSLQEGSAAGEADTSRVHVNLCFNIASQAH